MKRINIFGSSPRLKEAGPDYINKVLSLKSPSIGINHFPNVYPNVEYWLFSDYRTAARMKYNGQKILTNINVKNKLLDAEYPDWKVVDTWHHLYISENINNSAFYAIWWAVKSGYTNIYLYGIHDDIYNEVASGDIIYNSMFSPKLKRKFDGNNFKRLEKIIESGYDNRARIHRPLQNLRVL